MSEWLYVMFIHFRVPELKMGEFVHKMNESPLERQMK